MKRGAVFWVAVALAVVLGFVVDRWTASSGRPAAFADAHRVWWDHDRDKAPGAPPPGVAFSFWLVRDFALDPEQLARGEQTARLVLVGDPEVLVYWNGVLVQSSHYRVGDSATVLDVTQLLRANNRILLEVRSDHGVGGVMAALWLDDWVGSRAGPAHGASPLWVTDEEWRATRQFDPWLLDAWLPLDSARLAGRLLPVRTWPSLDLGRWQPLRVAEQVRSPTWPSARQSRRLPARIVPFEPEETPPGSTPSWPPGFIVDFGETVDGCLSLGGNMTFARRAHFVESPVTFNDLHGPVEFAAAQRLGPGYRESWVLPLPGATSWLDAVPRRFRAVLLEGDPNRPAPGPDEVWVQSCATASDPVPPARLFGS